MKAVAAFCLFTLSLIAGPLRAADPLPPFIQVPPGYAIEHFATVPKARTLVPVPELGVIFVGQRGPQVHAIIDADHDGRPEKVLRLFDDLNVANGIDWKDGWLYIAEQHRISRWRARSLKELAAAEPEVLFDKLPDDPWHGWRYARIGPDGLLYVAIGAPCNICDLNGMEGTIIRLAPPGRPGPRTPEIFARGVRNSVGFDFQPGTGHLYFTDNGADNMGDDVPPDEFNHAPEQGLWFGFPFFGGGEARTEDFRDRPLPAPHNPPAVAFGAHVAALGMSFYRGDMFPRDARGDAFVAHHGSWNRTEPDGYRVARVRFDKTSGKALSWEPFATGFLRPDGARWGRPVDVKELADGSLLVSDDYRGVIYRITYKGLN
ncbi:MAG: PQQ-dependent sugar dehydrogenase [Rhodospirillales bacterium]